MTESVREFLTEQLGGYLLSGLWAATCAAAGTLLVKYRSMSRGVQGLLRAEIIRSYEKYTERGYCPIYAKEALTKEYRAYHGLGGNDVATGLYEELMKLPAEIAEK